MPLRDHFHPPLSTRAPWGGVHGQWPAMIVLDLNKRLPPEYVSRPRIQLGTAFEIDVGAAEPLELATFGADQNAPDDDGGGVATAVWAPPLPSLSLACDPFDQDEYEVQILETTEWRLVAAIEIVSLANKDRPQNRRAFAARCATLLAQGVAVSIVDVVTRRRANLYGELLETIGKADPALTSAPPSIYATACRWREVGKSGRLESWTHVLKVEKRLPTLPLWLAPDLAVPLDLESTYEETCRALRIA